MVTLSSQWQARFIALSCKEQCSVRDAALKLQDWFKVGETGQGSLDDTADHTENVNSVQRGIYRDEAGALFEVISAASNAEDFEPMVAYRELFGEYQFQVGPFRPLLLILSTPTIQSSLW
jgi:hypothetical protein